MRLFLSCMLVRELHDISRLFLSSMLLLELHGPCLSLKMDVSCLLLLEPHNSRLLLALHHRPLL